ncbi:MAG TPA: DUF4136 domain-containing protein [Phycisphaerae bacterium]|nr:DUF4136 domain-containing protein [Phycisphaerae bacterium]
MTLRQCLSVRSVCAAMALVGATISAGCSDTEPITASSRYGPGVKLSGLGPTYAWSPSPSIDPANPPFGNVEFVQMLHRLVEKELAAKGFAPASPQSANFWVDCRIGKREKTDSGVNPHGEVFNEGSLVLDVLEPQSGKLIWRAVAQARILPDATTEVRNKRLNTAVQRLMKDFPPK